MSGTKNNTSYNLFSRKGAAMFLTDRGIPTAPATLAKKACVGGGPKFLKIGKRVLYEQDELIAWVQATALSKASTSDPGQSVSFRQGEM